MLPVASGPGTWRVRGRLFVCPWWEPSAHGKGKSKGKSKGKAKGKTAAWKQFSSHVCPVRLSQGLGGLRFRVDSQAQPGRSGVMMIVRSQRKAADLALGRAVERRSLGRKLLALGRSPLG